MAGVVRGPYYLVLDVEATCCDDGSIPQEEMEVIEVGAVLICMTSLERAFPEAFHSHVRPVRHPTLTEYCRVLTGITQAQVDAAPGFPKVWRALEEWTEQVKPTDHTVSLSSWGDYDRRQLAQDRSFHGMSVNAVLWKDGTGHYNLKEMFKQAQSVRKRCGLQRALRRVGLEFEGRHHYAPDDAHNAARLLPWCEGRIIGRPEAERKGKKR